MKWLYLMVGALGLLLAGTASAVDGDGCDSDIGKLDQGSYQTVVCVNVCDGVDNAGSDCDRGSTAAGHAWDFNQGGMPDLIVFEYEDNGGDCGGSTPDFTLTTSPEADGTPAYDISTSTVVVNPTTNRVVVVVKDAVIDRYLNVDMADVANCTDLDLRMYLINEDES